MHFASLLLGTLTSCIWFHKHSSDSGTTLDEAAGFECMYTHHIFLITIGKWIIWLNVPLGSWSIICSKGWVGWQFGFACHKLSESNQVFFSTWMFNCSSWEVVLIEFEKSTGKIPESLWRLNSQDLLLCF